MFPTVYLCVGVHPALPAHGQTTTYITHLTKTCSAGKNTRQTPTILHVTSPSKLMKLTLPSPHVFSTLNSHQFPLKTSRPKPVQHARGEGRSLYRSNTRELDFGDGDILEVFCLRMKPDEMVSRGVWREGSTQSDDVVGCGLTRTPSRQHHPGHCSRVIDRPEKLLPPHRLVRT